MTRGILLVGKLTNDEDIKKEYELFEKIMNDIEKIPKKEWKYNLTSMKFVGATQYQEMISTFFKTGPIVLLKEGFSEGYLEEQTYENIKEEKYSVLWFYGNQGEEYKFDEEFFQNNSLFRTRVSRLDKELYNEHKRKLVEKESKIEKINLKKRSLDNLESALTNQNNSTNLITSFKF